MPSAPHQTSPNKSQAKPESLQPSTNGFNEWVRSRSKWFWICTVVVVWMIGIAIVAVQPSKDLNNDAGHRAEQILKSRGWDKDLPEAKQDAPPAAEPAPKS
jgi:hypothetical protein